MNININFNTDNADFEDSFLMAVTKALQQCKNVILDSENTNKLSNTIRDTNGNCIGVINID